MSYEILIDKQLAHRSTFDSSPKVGRVQLIRVDANFHQCNFWYDAGHVVKVDSWPLDGPALKPGW